ncbi:hypothetical protein HanPSC8_Chr01g0012271 [Helianthus annuus]|nr:hypothetical protein HanPSC8_Chr01g0012271 [Helianthus annuus]
MKNRVLGCRSRVSLGVKVIDDIFRSGKKQREKERRGGGGGGVVFFFFIVVGPIYII